MINLIVVVDKQDCNLRKLLLSILLQTCCDKINTIFVFKKKNLSDYFKNDICLFQNKLKIESYVYDGIDIFDFCMSKVRLKYTMFLSQSSFFYDAFSIENLYNAILKEENSDFVFGSCVNIVDDLNYDYIDNYYASINGKLFNSKFIMKSTLFNKNEFCFVSECYLCSENNCYVDSTIVVDTIKGNLVENINYIVDNSICVYNMLVGKIDNKKMCDYIFKNYEYVYNLFFKNVVELDIENFYKIVNVLDGLYRKLLKEV